LKAVAVFCLVVVAILALAMLGFFVQKGDQATQDTAKAEQPERQLAKQETTRAVAEQKVEKPKAEQKVEKAKNETSALAITAAPKGDAIRWPTYRPR
jgi:uncharacterized protein HemX